MSVNNLLRNKLRDLKQAEEKFLFLIGDYGENIKINKDRLAEIEDRLKEFRSALDYRKKDSYVTTLIRREMEGMKDAKEDIENTIDMYESRITKKKKDLAKAQGYITEIRTELGNEDEHEGNELEPENGMAFIDPSKISTKVWTSLEKPNAMKISTGKIDTGCITSTKIADIGITTAKITDVDIKPIHFVKSDRLTSLGVALDKTLRKMQRAMGIKR